MARRGTFTVDAESVQGNAGATITFRQLKVREVRAIRDGEADDEDVLTTHIAAWSGILDDDGNELPSPQDEPGILGELYVQEQTTIIQLLFAGPDGASAKN